ncbi:hypothetical protein ABZ671_10820 [Micromonospora sp. NPDC006766]|uniref:hypothetical protein n=1 Tax=Micromonospora sp. NPDC006766 TaxID=3154778 RepID=UPI0033ECC5A0
MTQPAPSAFPPPAGPPPAGGGFAPPSGPPYVPPAQYTPPPYDGFWQLWDKPWQQCLHDKFAGTVVVKVAP